MNDSGESSAPRSPKGDFVMSRVFNAPRDLVFSLWTESRHLMHWFTPRGYTMPKCKLDLRPGGVFHYCLRLLDGYEMWGKWTFREIERPAKLVFLVSFADAKGNPVRHPGVSDWPMQTLSTIEFEETGDKTTVTVRWATYSATPAEQKVFDGGHEGMRLGWAGTFDQLEEYIRESCKSGLKN